MIEKAPRNPGPEANEPLRSAPRSSRSNHHERVGGRSFAEVLERLGSQIDRGEALVKRAVSGAGTRDAGDLIALQAGIYRYTEAVDLAAKLVDRTTAAVKTTLQGSGG